MAAAELHPGIDVLAGREALLEHPDRRHQIRDQKHVDDEAGAVLRPDRLLAHLLGEREGAHLGGGRGVERDDDLDQLHHRNRAEEVQAADVVGPVGGAGELGDRDRRGVRGDHDVVADPLGDRREDLALEIGDLGDRLDDELGPLEGIEAGREVDSLEHRGGVVELAALDRLREGRPDPLARATQRRLVDLDQRDADPGDRRGFGDAAPHEAAADDPDPAGRLVLDRRGAAHRERLSPSRCRRVGAVTGTVPGSTALWHTRPPRGSSRCVWAARFDWEETQVRRVGSVLIVAIVALAAAIIPAAATAAGKGKKDTARYVLPPGNYGGLPFTEHSTDQLPLYSGLTPLRDNVTKSDINDLFLPEDFAPIGDAHEEDTGEPGLRLVYDAYGIPHVYGKTRYDVAFGAGWSTARDRQLLLTLGRGPARAAVADVPNLDAFSLVTSGQSFVPSDEAEALVTKQRHLLVKKYGKKGKQIVSDASAYADGINAYMEANGIDQPPANANDVIAVTAFIGSIFGAGGGGSESRLAGSPHLGQSHDSGTAASMAKVTTERSAAR